jgi:hypothetical protein
MATVHLAGPVIRLKDRAIQRCVICGSKLVDGFFGHVQMFPNEGLVEVSDASGLTISYIPENDGTHEIWPENICFDLIEE